MSPQARQLDPLSFAFLRPFLAPCPSHSIITCNSGLDLPPRFGTCGSRTGRRPSPKPDGLVEREPPPGGWLAGNRRHLSSTALLVIRKEKCLHDLHYMQENLVSWPSTQVLGFLAPFNVSSSTRATSNALSAIPCTLTWHTAWSHTSWLDKTPSYAHWGPGLDMLDLARITAGDVSPPPTPKIL